MPRPVRTCTVLHTWRRGCAILRRLAMFALMAITARAQDEGPERGASVGRHHRQTATGLRYLVPRVGVTAERSCDVLCTFGHAVTRRSPSRQWGWRLRQW